MKLAGNTILITGGSAGIGLAFAKKFLELGNEVIVTGRDQAKLDAAAKALPKLTTIRSDAGDPKAIAALAQQIKEQHPKLDVLFNNAGIMVYRNLAAGGDPDALISEININLSGPIRLIASLVELLKENKGTVINVSSGLAFVPLLAAPIYCATKAALHSYTISLRTQLAEHGVQVVELMPPAVNTDLVQQPEGVKMLTTDQLVAATLKALQRGTLEIRPGQANQLRFMSRWAPGFITGVLAKGSKSLIPPS